MPSPRQYDTHKPKELRRFYEPLGILYRLNDQTKPHSMFSSSGRGIDIMQRRRDFVDSIAYIGAYSKECEIAVALERQPDRLILRVAGTGDIETTTVPFLNDLLSAVSHIVKSGTDGIRGELKESIVFHLSEIALDFAEEKTFAQYMKILRIASICLEDITTGLNGADGDCLRFRAWFQENFYKNSALLTKQDMKALARKCIHARQSGQLEVLGKFTFQGNKHLTYFEKFYKKLTSLSRTIDMVSKLFESIVSLRQDLANDLVAEGLPPSTSLPIPLLPRKLTLEGIANRMFSKAVERDEFLRKLEQTAPAGLTKTLVDYSREVATKVHPELIIINYFDGLTVGGFLDDNDKYIGRTKPSCYLCHLFVSHHPAKYSAMSANSNLCLDWRLPDISRHEGNAMARAETQKSILRKLINTIRKELEEQVNKAWEELQSHFSDSETQSAVPIDEDDDDTFPCGSPPPSPKLTPASPTTSINQVARELDTELGQASGADNTSDEDEKDIIVFKGRCRH
ncbi:hypothetical protein BJX63DRAFT_442745 [Aspergillus granulosus]|uniref:Uncharacterized protein n=1 Tax=Aspergillus granulosus TaxID=176169 RepID=A0ABR4HEG5_9EURO